MEDKISALLQENHEAQIPILYVKSRRKMNGIWLKDISSRFPRDCHSAESWWLFPGCSKCGGGFPFTEFLSVSTPCSMKSPMKPGTTAQHGVPALQPPERSKTSVREYCLALGASVYPPKPDLHQEGADRAASSLSHEGCDLLWGQSAMVRCEMGSSSCMSLGAGSRT